MVPNDLLLFLCLLKNGNVMNYWQMVYSYFEDQGFPDALLDFVCIHLDEANQIIDTIEKKQPKSLLEIGTFIGLSTGLIALASAPTSTLICVDPNLPVDIFSKKFNYCESRGSLEFVRTMLEHFGIHQKVILLEGYFSCTSSSYKERFIALGGNAEAIESKKIDIVGEGAAEFAPYDLVFVDGDHSAESVFSDLSLVHHHISEDGIIILHDLDLRGYWGRHVHAGITQFLRDHVGFSININENLGFLRRETHSTATL
jgi:predicted O-methyltransferase YrrM